MSEFYRPGIDYLINFADARCVRWSIQREASNRLEGQTIAHAVIAEGPNTIPFFVKNSRNILAHLFGEQRLPAEQICRLIAHPDDLVSALRGTQYEQLLTESGEIRNGILGNLNYALDPLSLLPHDEGHQEFSVRDWCWQGKDRKGHIFLASTPNDFEAQKPLQSLILDLLFLGMQSCHGPGIFILDEIGVFDKIPRLPPAFSIQRSSGNPVVVAFQGFGQLRQNYGVEQAEEITSGPFTRLILRLSSPKEAKYGSELLGMPAEVERLRESNRRIGGSETSITTTRRNVLWCHR